MMSWMKTYSGVLAFIEATRLFGGDTSAVGDVISRKVNEYKSFSKSCDSYVAPAWTTL